MHICNTKYENPFSIQIKYLQLFSWIVKINKLLVQTEDLLPLWNADLRAKYKFKYKKQEFMSQIPTVQKISLFQAMESIYQTFARNGTFVAFVSSMSRRCHCLRSPRGTRLTSFPWTFEIVHWCRVAILRLFVPFCSLQK